MLERVTWRAWSWILPVALGLLAFALRVVRLGEPPRLAFDETYYAKDAWSLLHFGYVRDFVEDADKRIEAGDLSGLFAPEPSWIVHPDGGKWLIALGEAAFGMTPFGWRIGAVVAGSLTVLILTRLIIGLTGSLWIGAVGGLLLTLDGVHFVMSRLALLDVFLTFWLVLALAFLVADRNQLQRRLDEGRDPGRWRGWQLAAGAAFGAAVATKWSGLYVLAVFGVCVVCWELAARGELRRLGRWLRVGLPAFVRLVVVAAFVYLASWIGWFAHRGAYEDRFGHGYGDYAAWPSVEQPGGAFDAIRSWWSFHVMTWDFHTGDYLADKTHPYASNPLGWLVQWRPVAVDTTTDVSPERCGAPADSSCISEVLIVGNPLIWWVGVVALLVVLLTFVRRPSWRLSLPLAGLVATWLPWFFSTDRPIFSFYSVAILPFVVIAICLMIQGPYRRAAAAESGRTRWVALPVTGFVVLVIAAFVFFYPLWTDVLLSYDTWRQRIWLPGWI